MAENGHESKIKVLEERQRHLEDRLQAELADMKSMLTNLQGDITRLIRIEEKQTYYGESLSRAFARIEEIEKAHARLMGKHNEIHSLVSGNRKQGDITQQLIMAVVSSTIGSGTALGAMFGILKFLGTI